MARDQDSKLMAALPVQYRGDFRACLQSEATSEIGRALLARMDAIETDLGGAENVSNVARSQARDFVALDMLVEGLICRIAAGELVDAGALTQLMNSKAGIARSLGIDRRPKRVRSLREVMDHAKASRKEATQ